MAWPYPKQSTGGFRAQSRPSNTGDRTSRRYGDPRQRGYGDGQSGSALRYAQEVIKYNKQLNRASLYAGTGFMLGSLVAENLAQQGAVQDMTQQELFNAGMAPMVNGYSLFATRSSFYGGNTVPATGHNNASISGIRANANWQSGDTYIDMGMGYPLLPTYHVPNWIWQKYGSPGVPTAFYPKKAIGPWRINPSPNIRIPKKAAVNPVVTPAYPPTTPWYEPGALPVFHPTPAPWSPPYRDIPLRPRPLYTPVTQPEVGPAPSPEVAPRAPNVTGRAIQTNPRTGRTTRPRNASVRRQPPRRGDKEKKFILGINPKSPLGWALGGITEGLDLVRCVYKGVPKNKRPRTFTTPQDKVRIIYENFGNLNWGDAFWACLQDQATDRFWAKVGKMQGAAKRKVFDETGISLNGMGQLNKAASEGSAWAGRQL